LWHLGTKAIVFRDNEDTSTVTYPTGASAVAVRVQIDGGICLLSAGCGAENCDVVTGT
jgi:hypothetical protein